MRKGVESLGTWRYLFAALAAIVALAVVPAIASAQDLPPICDEYPELPVCSEDGGGDIDDPADDDTSGDIDDETGAALPGSGGDGGSLPFTGYPLTPLLLLLLILLATGLAIRAWIAYRDRRLASASATDSGPLLGA